MVRIVLYFIIFFNSETLKTRDLQLRAVCHAFLLCEYCVFHAGPNRLPSIEYAYPRDANVKTSDDITSSCFAGLNQRRDDNENDKEAIDLISKSTILHVRHTFLYISWNYPISRFMENKNMQRRNKISLSKFGYGP